MMLRSRLVVLAALVGVMPATAAHAQYYGPAYRQPPPLYPYAVPAGNGEMRRHRPVKRAAARTRKARIEATAAARDKGEDGQDKVRVIRAEAEVTIFGPGNMTIRLFRKDSGDGAARGE